MELRAAVRARSRGDEPLMRIAIGVHGRFSAFNIATGLLELGEDFRLFTNYPRSVVNRFGVPPERTRGFVAHGVATRVAGRIFRGRRPEAIEAALHRSFGAWLERQTRKGAYDVAYCWSGIAEETFRERGMRNILSRSSVHIQVQHDLLAEESRRVGRAIDMPGEWRIERETREYALADVIIVPSRSAAASFAGTPAADRVAVVPLTASGTRWRPEPNVVNARVRRIGAREPLRVLFVGALSFQKGMFDLARVVKNMNAAMEFRFTGSVSEECRDLVRDLAHHARFDGHVPELQLRESYAWADILVCPSIQDGFAVVLSHA